MEKSKSKKIKKWDEINGSTEIDVVETLGESAPEEMAGASPSISRNPMRGIEDMIEQNDNSFDGIINNVKVEPQTGALEKVKPEKESLLDKIKDTSKAPNINDIRKKVIHDCDFTKELT